MRHVVKGVEGPNLGVLPLTKCFNELTLYVVDYNSLYTDLQSMRCHYKS